MVFKDQRVSFKGLRNYKMVIWSLRFNGKLFFKQPYVEVLRIWQPEDNIIKCVALWLLESLVWGPQLFYISCVGGCDVQLGAAVP